MAKGATAIMAETANNWCKQQSKHGAIAIDSM